MKFKKCIMTLMCALSVLLSSFALGFESEASVGTGTNNLSFMVPYSKPSTDYGQGYVTLIFRDNSNGNNYSLTYFWSISQFLDDDADVGVGDTFMYVNLASNEIRLTPQVMGLDYGTYALSKYIFNDQLVLVASNSFQGNYYFEEAYPSGCTLIGYEYGGNVSMLSTSVASAPIDIQWNVGKVYSDYVYLLNQLISLQPSNTYFTNLYNKVLAISNNTESLENRVREIQELLLDEFDRIWREINASNKKLDSIYEELQDIHKDLLESQDSSATDKFKGDSDGQSDKLNNLNEQNKIDKIDVDSASSSVDANIDGNAISNYGVVLSSITGQGKVVQLMLIVLSVGLVSYVLFGKR